MAEVTNELMYEVLRTIQARLDRMDTAIGEIRHEIVSIRLSQLSTQNDIHNIYGVVARQDERLDRIERRLDLRELAEAQHGFDPNA